MVEYLKVRNLALIEEVTLEFGRGFIGVTGETGAGKSVLLGALQLAAGQRADKGLIRHGADACEIEAVLHVGELPGLASELETLGLPPCEDGVLLLRRTLHREKAARVQVNGAITTAQALQSLAAHWFDFHGPDASQSFRRPGESLALLDAWADHASALDAYRQRFEAWQATRREIEECRNTEALSPEEAAFLQGELEKFDAIELTAEAIEGLERDFSRVERLQELVGLANRLSESLDGDDGVAEKLAGLISDASDLVEIDQEGGPLLDRLEATVVEVRDLAECFAELGQVEFEEEQVAEIRQRMEAWLALDRRYGPGVEAVLTRRAAMVEKLANQGDLAERLDALEAQARQQEAEVSELAEGLTRTRRAAARKLEKGVAGRLSRLGFRKAVFAFEISRAKSYGPTGADVVEMRFTPNPGSPPQPLATIASSGEAARVMLAVKASLAEADATPVLVFDEVDANVGGEVAVALAEELSRLGREHQVFCITHLPQVAARAQEHWLVAKEQKRNASLVTIRPVHGDPALRQEELARMLGDRKSASARKHAEALLAG